MTKPRDHIHHIAIQVQDVEQSEKNVLGGELALHCHAPQTGFYRDGYCRTGEVDTGSHVIAAIVTDEFLEFTKSRGNDLQAARPMYDFPGLKAGDQWCLCLSRWVEAHAAGKAPKVVLEATHASALEFIDLEELKKFALR